MARPRTCRSLCHNLPPGSEDKLTEGPPRVPNEGSNTPTHSSTVFCAPTSAPPSTDELFKQFMKAYLESNQGPKQPLKERKQHLKAKVPDVYYDKLHMDCYHFCQQCEDHFETSQATRTNWTPFAVFFLCEILVYSGRNSSVVKVKK